MFSGRLTFESMQNTKIGRTRTIETKVSVGLYEHQGKRVGKSQKISKLQDQFVFILGQCIGYSCL